MTSNLRSVMTHVDALLFDFDGPLCDVFAGLPAPFVARELEALTGHAFTTNDPLEVMRQSYETCDTDTAHAVEDALIDAELRAVRSSRAERAGLEALQAGAAAGLAIGVVTNNARESAAWFLRSEGVSGLVQATAGREFRRPELMKPDPWPVHLVLHDLGVPAGRAVLVGDSTTDIDAARVAEVPCVAFANKPGKRAVFEAAGAAAVIEDMGELRDVLVELGDRRG